MTSQDRSTPPQQQYAERSYRSPAALAGGALLLLLGLWLGGDALLRGDAHTRLTALFALLLGVPLVTAFTLRPLVRAGEDRLTVRNPFRTITLPWDAVEGLRAGYSTEVVTADGTYQMWAIPSPCASARKPASRRRAAPGPSPLRPARRRRAHPARHGGPGSRRTARGQGTGGARREQPDPGGRAGGAVVVSGSRAGCGGAVGLAVMVAV